MDPQETLKNFLTSLTIDDPDGAHEAGSNLLRWLDKGGFTPKVSDAAFCTMLVHLLACIECAGLNGMELSPEYLADSRVSSVQVQRDA